MRRVHRPFGVLVLGCWLTLCSSTPTNANDVIDALEGRAKLDALLDHVVQRQRSLIALRADFVQVKQSSMLLEAVKSSGEFRFQAPDRVRWDYLRPVPMIVLFADGTVTTYHPEQARAEQLKISKQQRRFVRVLAGTQPLDDLTSHFSVTLADPGDPSPYLLTLRPAGKMLARRLSMIKIEVDRRLLLPVAIEYHETDGDSTRYEFHDMVIDPELDDDRFRLVLGEGVRVETIDASPGID